MTKKPKQSKKGHKISNRTKGPARPDEESDTAIQSEVAEGPQPAPTPKKPKLPLNLNSR